MFDRMHKSLLIGLWSLLIILTVVPVPAGVLAQETPSRVLAQDTLETTARFDQLVAARREVPRASVQERQIDESIQDLIERLLGPESVQAYGRYLGADVNSEESRNALRMAQEGISRRVRWPRARDLLDAYWRLRDPLLPLSASASPSVMGLPPLGSASSQVDIALESTQASAAGGASFAVEGTITNRRDEPVWIVDKYTTLSAPPHISERGEAAVLTAVFPSLQSAATEAAEEDAAEEAPPATEEPGESPGSETDDQVVRLDALGSYLVRWDLDDPSFLESFQFHPGEYRFTAQVHTWTRPPVLSRGRAINTSDSGIVLGEARIEIGLSIWTLVAGAMIGGVLALLLRFAGMYRMRQQPARGWLGFIAIGTLGAIVGPAVGTVLIARIGEIDTFISLSINDLWGAVASGFLLEWLGLWRLMESLRKEATPATS